MTRFRSLLLPLLALLMALPAPPAGAQLALNGAGATFPAPLYTKWFNEYAARTGTQINYQAIGSGGGIRAITDRTVDFGASDGIMTEAQESAAPGILHIPTVSGAVAVTYNVPGLEGGLKLTPETLAGIFLGQVTRWNDPALADQNPGLALPNQDITVVHRSDSSGTTFIFTNYLSKVSPAWQSGVGASTSVNWPTGLGGQGNSGVANEVKQNPGAIGYVELAYAHQNAMAFADVRNAAGSFVTPTLDSTTAAAEGVALPDDMKVMLTNSPNPTAYPIVGFTWILVYQGQPDAAKGQAIVDMLTWALNDGQAYAPELDYAPLSPTARDKALALVQSISY